MRPVIRSRPYGEGPVPRLRFPVTFRCAAFRFLAVLFPPRTSASLTVGLPAAGLRPPDLTGFPCFTLARYDRCRVLPVPRDRGALMADLMTSAITAASQRRVLSLAVTSHLPRSELTRLTGVHTIHPSSLPLARSQWMEHRPLGFLPGFTPHRYQRRMPGAGTSIEHSLGANRRTIDPPID